MPENTTLIKELAPVILAEIKKAERILLCVHVPPDPDSVASNLAMKFALEGMSKKVTLIKGDHDIPVGFLHFPGARDIEQKNFFDVDLAKIDLFMLLDAGTLPLISKIKPIPVPLPVRTIGIDHHRSNDLPLEVKLVDSTVSSTSEILFELFKEWKVPITHDIAANLYMGMYADTGGFKYQTVTPRTYEIAAELVKVATDFSRLVSQMENSESPEFFAFRGAALSNIETFLDGHVALSIVTNDVLTNKKIPIGDIRTSAVSSEMKQVAKWDVTGSLVEMAPTTIKCSLRSKDMVNYDVSKLAMALGGGGHKSAAAMMLAMPLDEAKKKIVSTAKSLYNL